MTGSENEQQKRDAPTLVELRKEARYSHGTAVRTFQWLRPRMSWRP